MTALRWFGWCRLLTSPSGRTARRATPSGTYGPWPGGPRRWRDRHGYASGYGSRACGRGDGCWAGKSACPWPRYSLLVCLRPRSAPGEAPGDPGGTLGACRRDRDTLKRSDVPADRDDWRTRVGRPPRPVAGRGSGGDLLLPVDGDGGAATLKDRWQSTCPDGGEQNPTRAGHE